MSEYTLKECISIVDTMAFDSSFEEEWLQIIKYIEWLESIIGNQNLISSNDLREKQRIT